MEKLMTVIMYVLWVLTVAMAVAATFTDFKYEDLNIIAGLLFLFSLLNSYFVLSKRR